MEVLLAADGHYYRDKKGEVYAESIYDYDFYKRYRMAFDKVYAVVRVEYVEEAPKGKRKASGEGVEFLDLPSYTGPWEYFLMYPRLKKLAKEYCKMAPCGIFRIPGAPVNFLCKAFWKTRKPFAVELVVDPWANFARGSVKSVLRVPVRVSWTNLARKMCMKANGASYVTSRYLQERYPCAALKNKGGRAFTASYSSVELPDDSFAEPRAFARKDSYVISHVANVFSDYGKGHIPLMEAVRLVRSRGYDVGIRFIGDGPKLREFQDYAGRLGIGESVSFLGRFPNGMAVREAIRSSDLFVFPTRAEGLPRGLLEAMAEGLPCLSSPTCGIPEVLDGDFLCKYEDWAGFAEKIIRFLEHPEMMRRESERNLETARRFASSVLNMRRKEFYDKLRDAAEHHDNGRARA